MNPKLIVAILVIAAVPVCAHAQPSGAAKVSKADAQKVLKIIGGDKAKTRPIAISLSSMTRSIKRMKKTIRRELMSCFEKGLNWRQRWVPNMPR